MDLETSPIYATAGLIDKVRGAMRTQWLIVLHHRSSAILDVNHSNFHGRSTPLSGLQYQYTGYSHNPVDAASPY